jgi:hypothetical protein
MQYSIPQGPKAIYIVHIQVCKYVENPLTNDETTIYKYTSNRNLLRSAGKGEREKVSFALNQSRFG